jgi:hypothetical protein
MFHNVINENIAIPTQNILLPSFIGGGSKRKLPTYRKSLKTLSHNVVSNTPRHEWDLNSQLLCAEFWMFNKR